MTINTADNIFGVAALIVDPTSGSGTHTTIGSAITSASSGQTIFVRPGTYTENLTLKAGVNITAFDCDSSTPNVTILGNCTLSTAGTVSISGIRLKTNSANCLTVSGSVASILNLYNCQIDANNNTAISYSSSSPSSSINCYGCTGNIDTTGITYITATGAGGVVFSACVLNNAGSSTTASSTSSCQLTLTNCIAYFALSTSSSGSVAIYNTTLATGLFNTTTVTTAGTGTSIITNSYLTSGTASTFSIGTGTTIQASTSLISSSNANAITGAGTLTSSNLSYLQTSTINPSTNTLSPVGKNYLPLGLTFDNSNTLSTYAVGTFTPTITGGGSNPTPTYTQQSGEYIKIGALVYVTVTVTMSALTGGTGNLQVSGLPFTALNVANVNPAGMGLLIISAAQSRTLFRIGSNTTNISAITNTDGANIALPQTGLTTVQFTLMYQATS